MANTFDKSKILDHLKQRFEQVNDLINKTEEEKLHRPRGNKWSTAELIHHMILTTASVASMLKYSPALLKMRFGTPKHSSRQYSEILDHYNSHFEEPRKAPEKYVPKSDAKIDRDSLQRDWNSIFPKFVERLKKWTEADLDQTGAPHPIVEMLTVREHLYVAILHLDLHLGQLKAEGLYSPPKGN